jgi:hypothetical protein
VKELPGACAQSNAVRSTALKARYRIAPGEAAGRPKPWGWSWRKGDLKGGCRFLELWKDLYRPYRADSIPLRFPGLTPWALLVRAFSAEIGLGGRGCSEGLTDF